MTQSIQFFASIINSLSTSGAINYTTQSALYADLAHPAGAIGVVTNDPLPSNNDYYLKTGPIGLGGWQIQFVNRAGPTGLTSIADLTNSANYQRSLENQSTPDTYYALSVSGSNLNIDISHVALLYAGIRMTQIFQAGGRVFNINASFDPSGSTLTSASALVLGFDSNITTGSNVIFGTGAAGWSWRSDGNIQSISLYNEAILSGYAFTLTSGTLTTWAVSDLISLQLVLSLSGTSGVLSGSKNGIVVFTGNVAAIPAGNLVAAFRGEGGGSAYPSAARMIFSNVSTGDPIQSPVVTNVNITNSPLASIITTPGLVRAQPLSPTADVNAFLPRTPPTGFSWLPITPSIVRSAGDVLCSTSSLGAVFQRYPQIATGTCAYVSTTGSDSTGKVGNSILPYLTINAALESTASLIVVNDGIYAPIDYRFSGAAQGVMKAIVAMNRGRAIIRQPGDTLATNSWTATPGQAGVYQTTIAAASGAASWLAFAPHHVRLTDTLDNYGYPARLRQFPAANTGAVAAAITTLQTAGTGWVWDGTIGNKILYVALGGQNVSTYSSRLMALYYNFAATDRNYIAGGNIAIDGLYMDGTFNWAQEWNNSGTYISSSLWISNSWIINSNSYGVQGDSNTTIVMDQCRIHASFQDCINCDSTRNSLSGLNTQANGLIVGNYHTSAGDVDTQGTGITSNNQGVSSHSGYFAAFGCLFEHNWGEEIADTGNSIATSGSWYVGCVARNGDTRLGSGRTGFGFFAGGLGNRNFWLDTCQGLNEGTNPCFVENASGKSAIGKIFNCTFDQAIVTSGGASTPTTYTPSTP